MKDSQKIDFRERKRERERERGEYGGGGGRRGDVDEDTLRAGEEQRNEESKRARPPCPPRRQLGQLHLRRVPDALGLAVGRP